MNKEKIWYALMDEYGMFLKTYGKEFRLKWLKVVDYEIWESSPNLRNKKAMEIYLIPAKKKLGGTIVSFTKSSLLSDSDERVVK